MLDWNGKKFDYSNLNTEQKEFVKNYLGILAKKGKEGMKLYNKLKYTDVKINFQDDNIEGGYGTAYETKFKDYENKSGIEEIYIGINFQLMEDNKLTSDAIVKVITEECVHAEQLLDADKEGKLKDLLEQRAYEYNLPYEKRVLENEAKSKVESIVNSSYK